MPALSKENVTGILGNKHNLTSGGGGISWGVGGSIGGGIGGTIGGGGGGDGSNGTGSGGGDGEAGSNATIPIQLPDKDQWVGDVIGAIGGLLDKHNKTGRLYELSLCCLI